MSSNVIASQSGLTLIGEPGVHAKQSKKPFIIITVIVVVILIIYIIIVYLMHNQSSGIYANYAPPALDGAAFPGGGLLPPATVAARNAAIKAAIASGDSKIRNKNKKKAPVIKS